MKSLRFFLIVFSLGWLTLLTQKVKAQCAMCSTAVESNHKSGANTTKGLNNGILFLLGAPYLAVAVVGCVWYKKYRRKNVDLQMPTQRIHLN